MPPMPFNYWMNIVPLRCPHANIGTPFALVLVFVITMMFAPSAATSDARSEAVGDAGTSSRPSDNADEVAPPAPGGLVGSKH